MMTIGRDAREIDDSRQARVSKDHEQQIRERRARIACEHDGDDHVQKADGLSVSKVYSARDHDEHLSSAMNTRGMAEEYKSCTPR